MAIDLLRLEAAADLFMDAGFSDQGWQMALDSLCAAAGSCGGALLPMTRRVPGPLVVSEALREGLVTYFKDGWINRDVRMRSLSVMLKTGITSDFDVTTPDMMRSDPYYQDFCRPCGVPWYAGLGFRAGDDVWAASIQRTSAQGPFTPDELRALASVSGRISRGATIAADVDRARVSGLSDGLEILNRPSVLINRGGEVVHINSAAQKLLNKGITIKDRMLTASRSEDEKLRRFINALASFEEPLPAIAAGNLTVKRANGSPLLFRGQRLHAGPAWLYFSQCRAIVTIVDPDARKTIDKDALRQLFKFTEAEARVAAALFQADGNTTLAAARLGISYETIRSHLKSIFNKADVNHQGQLLATIAQFEASTSLSL